MPKLRLDYQHSMSPFSWGASLLLVLAMVILIAGGIHYHNLHLQFALLKSNAGRKAHLTDAPPDKRMTVEVALEVMHANEVLRQLSVPWGGLFQTLESVGGKEVTLLAIAPDTKKGLIKISGEAKNIAAMLNYVEQLENRDVFGTVYLQSHHVQLQDPDKPVRFVLQATWRGKS